MAYWTALLVLLLFLGNWPHGQGQSATSLIDAYSPTSVLSSPATVPQGTTVVLVCRVGGVASGTQISYTWTCPNGPCDVGEGNNPNRKTYGDRMVLNVLTSRDGGTYTCLVREGQGAVHESSFPLTVQGGTVLSSYNRLIPNNVIIFDNGVTQDTNVGGILPPDGSSSVAVIDCSTDKPTQPLTWTDGAGQPVPTSPNLTVYQTTNGSSAALHINTTDTSTFTNGRYQCDGGMERTVNMYINQEGAAIELPDLKAFFRATVATFILTQATAERSERYISSLERTDLGVPLEVEFEETQSSDADGDMIDRHVSAPGAVYNVQIWSINGSTFSTNPLPVSTTLNPETAPSVPRLLSVTRNLSDGFELNWLPPREPNGRPVYEIEYGTDDTNFTTVDTRSGDTHYNLTGLQHNTTYYIRVVAVNYPIFDDEPLRGEESETLTVKFLSQPTPSPTTTPTTTTTTISNTDMPSPGTPGGISGLFPIIIPASAVAALLLLLIVLLVLVTVCCTSQRRRRRQKKSKEKHNYDYVTPPVGYSSPAGGEDKDGYAVIGKDSHTLIMSNEASIKGVNGRERMSTVVESFTEGQGQSDHTYYNTVTGSELYQNKQTVDEADEEMRGQQQPPVYSNAGEKGGSAENTAAVLATHTPRPPSQDYATIPDKELEEGLYDTADDVHPQEADTQATSPTANYTSIVKPEQEGADETKQPLPVPAFDPESLYTQPDKTSKAKDGGYENIPDTPSPTTVEGDYESVDMPHASTEKQPKAPSATTAHHEAPDFGYDTVPEASGPVAEGGYEAVDIPHTKTATAREAEARKLPDKPTASRPGGPTGSIYETISDSTLPQPADVPPDYKAAHYPPSSPSAQDRSPPVQSTGSDGDNLYAEPERTVEKRAAKDKADGYATVDDKGGKVAQPQRRIPADELYSTPDMSQKRNRQRESQGSMGGEGPKGTPPDTPTAVDQLYATPDMSKKQRKQPHVSPPEEQQDKDDDEDATPITGVNSK